MRSDVTQFGTRRGQEIALRDRTMDSLSNGTRSAAGSPARRCTVATGSVSHIVGKAMTLTGSLGFTGSPCRY